MSRLVVLDNEPVQALADPSHPKHRRALSQLQVVVGRKRRALPISIAVPTAVRVEAGWDRTSPAWAFLNRLRIVDIPLDATHANLATGIGCRISVSAADAHVGAAVQAATADDITVVTSDPADMRQAAGDRPVTIVAI